MEKKEFEERRKEEWEENEEVVKEKLRWSRGSLDHLQVQGRMSKLGVKGAGGNTQKNLAF